MAVGFEGRGARHEGGTGRRPALELVDRVLHLVRRRRVLVPVVAHALAALANARGTPIEIAVPEGVPDEKKQQLRFLGAEVIEVEDDGPGIPESLVAELLTRGGRADPDVPGQGIGLAVVVELVREAHGGRLDIGASELGGARVRAWLPAVSG